MKCLGSVTLACWNILFKLWYNFYVHKYFEAKCPNYILLYIFREISKIQTSHDIKSCIKLYRYIQILEKSFNAFVAERLVPVIITCFPTIQISALFVCIRMHGEIAFPGFAIYPIMALSTVINNILIITLASKVNASSNTVLNHIEEKIVGHRVGKRGPLLKELRACGFLKIKFGSNFIDKGTPLVMQNFCINQTVSLCLLN